MASLILVPVGDSLFPTTSQCCPCSGGFRYSPIRRRNQLPCRWSPTADSVSRLFDLAERETEFENLWGPTLLLHQRERPGEKESNRNNAETNKQPESDKTEEKEAHTEQKTPDKFTVSVELGDAFEPNEISVKLVGRCLNIEGKHEETGDDGHFSCRQFTRSFYLPDDVDIENLTAALSKEGVLSVEAPRLQLKEKEPEERNIAIQQTTSPEAVTENKSEETVQNLDEDGEAKSEAGKSEEADEKESTSGQPQAAEAITEDSE